MNEHDKKVLAEFHEFVVDRLIEIAKWVSPDAKLTLMIRVPGDDDADCVITSDDMAELAALVARQKARKFDQTGGMH